MKKTKMISTYVLSSILLIGIATGPQALAEERQSVTTPGSVTFEPNDEDEISVIPPESGPDVVIPPVVEPNTGPLTIAYAPTLDFGEQVISNADETYELVAEMQSLADGSGKVPYTSFAQVSDTRGSNGGWNLRVLMSEFRSNSQNNVLTGAEITFKDPSIKYEGSNLENTPVPHSSNITLSPDTGSQLVMNAADGKGAGVTSVIWGDQEQLNADYENPDITTVLNPFIELSVPGSTVKDATTYQATLTWSLGSLPDGLVTP